MVKAGIRANLRQFAWLAAETVMVGLLIGTERTVVPLLGRDVYHVDAVLSLSFIATFGLAKAPLNLVAGRLSDRFGRRPVLIAGWLMAVPMIVLLLTVHHWWAVLLANVLLGANQAFAWTMTITSQLDLSGPRERGLAMGINEAAGYIGVALATVVAGYLAVRSGIEVAPFVFAALVVGVATLTAWLAIRETRVLVDQERPQRSHDARMAGGSVWASFVYTTFVEPSLSSATLAGLVNKLADTVAWGALPLFFAARHLSLGTISWLSGTYTLTWGLGQLGSGMLSDKIGRKPPIVGGLALLGAGLVLTPEVAGVFLWTLTAAVMGIGMSLLYPNLNSAVNDVAPAARRGTVLGVYRLWRDGGYLVGGVLGGLVLAGWGAGATVTLSGGVVLATTAVVAVRMRETHPPSQRGAG